MNYNKGVESANKRVFHAPNNYANCICSANKVRIFNAHAALAARHTAPRRATHHIHR